MALFFFCCVYYSQKKSAGGVAVELGMENMYGVFIVLLFGSSLASSFGFIEWFVIILQRSRKYKVNKIATLPHCKCFQFLLLCTFERIKILKKNLHIFNKQKKLICLIKN